jgi:DNA-binding transcriptional LysR family regulator
MDLRALQVFVEVASRGSFSSVARDRDVDPSSISRAISDLEMDLGVRLFQRTSRHMTLTEVGERFLADVEPLIGDFERARESAVSSIRRPNGTLRITASASFGQMRIVPLLPEFRSLYPELKVEGLFTDQNLDLISDRIELAIRFAPNIEGDLIASKLIDVSYRVVASPDYLKTAKPLILPSDLSSHRCVLFNIKSFRTRWIFRDTDGKLEEVPVDGDLILAPAGSLLSAALAGLGPAMLPCWLVDPKISAGRLVNIFPHHAVTATTFDTAAWIIYPTKTYLPTKVRVMIDFLRSKIVPRTGASDPLNGPAV